MSYEDHRILRHLDQPKRILYWTVGEFTLAFSIFVSGMILGYFFMGLIISFSLTYGLIKAKKKLGKTKLRHYLYWYFPHPKAQLPHFPPSYQRDILT